MTLMPDSSIWQGNPYYAVPDAERTPFLLNSFGSMLANLGAGMSSAGNSGQPWFAGVGPGAAMATRALDQQAASILARQQQAEMMELRRRGMAVQEGELQDKRDERVRLRAAADSYTPPGAGSVPGPDQTPGMNAPPPAPRTGLGNVSVQQTGVPMVQYLMQKHGLSPQAAAGVVGNLIQESSLDPTKVHDNGTGYGLAGWRLERRDALQKFAQDQGKQVSDPYMQLDFLANELKSGDMGAQRAYALLQQAKTPEEAAAAMMHFERPQGYTPANPTAGHGYQNRANYARGLMPGDVQVAQGSTESPTPVPSALPAFEGVGMPSIQPRANANPAWTQPPQQSQQQAYWPSLQPPAQSAGAPPPGEPPQVPRPSLSPEVAARLQTAVRTGQLTPQQADSEANRLITDDWSRRQATADRAWQMRWEGYRHQRGQTAEQQREQRRLETEGDYVRGADGVERFVPKSQRQAGQARYDKPPAAGTETGDIEVLNNGDPSSRGYLGAYNRVKSRLIDGPNNLKYVPDMSGYRQPTFVEPSAAPASTAAPATNADVSAGAGVSVPPAAPPGSLAVPPRPSATAAAAQSPSSATGTPAGLTPIGERTYTESQNKDHTYAERLNLSIPQLEAMVRDENGAYTTKKLPSSSDRAAMDNRFVPDSMLSPETKAFRRVTKDIVTAILRRESGANIPVSEYSPEYAKYIPQPGDSEKEIKAKLASLRVVARSIAEGTGRPLTTYGAIADGGGEQQPKATPIRIDASGRRQ